MRTKLLANKKKRKVLVVKKKKNISSIPEQNTSIVSSNCISAIIEFLLTHLHTSQKFTQLSVAVFLSYLFLPASFPKTLLTFSLPPSFSVTFFLACLLLLRLCVYKYFIESLESWMKRHYARVSFNLLASNYFRRQQATKLLSIAFFYRFALLFPLHYFLTEQFP